MSVMERPGPVRLRQSFNGEFKRDGVAVVLDGGNKIVDGAGEPSAGSWGVMAHPMGSASPGVGG